MVSVTFDSFKTSRSENIKILSDGTPNLAAKLLKREFQKGYSYDAWLNLIDLSNNGIKNIEANAFQAVGDCLKYIFLKNNILESIDVNAFIGLRELRKLDLSNNKLNYLPNYVFNDTNLDQLILRQNNLSGLDPLVFYRLANLTVLDLSMNQISEIKPEIFKDLEKLEVLDLFGNKIESLDQNSFQYLKGLNTLRLDSNNLKILPIGVFQHLNHLQVLSIGGNQLSEFQTGTFYGLQSLRDLNISYNLFTDVHEQKLFAIENLRTLILDGNNITQSINVREIMGHLIKLRTIGLADMPWNCTDLLLVMKAFALRGITVKEVRLRDPTHESLNIKGILCNDTSDENATVPLVPVVGNRVEVDEGKKEDVNSMVLQGLVYNYTNIHHLLIFMLVLNIVILAAIFKNDIKNVVSKRQNGKLDPGCRPISEVELLTHHS